MSNSAAISTEVSDSMGSECAAFSHHAARAANLKSQEARLERQQRSS
eukprot:CAMPEP_0174722554 /NCGR_PEP_ID=MMETSP1094-20130205/38747_1 /TAXON_ID=156173 /ORGANISM="Chrysochromulina brevifilum, Strain UTEX LB 985" /LENGTH=46 /DNA_ID= /DNA_START= /DNA_END= /DNA_ORIENTATION=